MAFRHRRSRHRGHSRRFKAARSVMGRPLRVGVRM